MEPREGRFHSPGCQFELCPFCEGNLLVDCECKYDFLGLRRAEHLAKYDHLLEEVYMNGLSDEQENIWERILTARGRIPFVYHPQHCGQCGKLWPKLFVVQDVVWDYYTGPELRDAMLCEACFQTLRQNVDKHQPRPAWLPSVEEIDQYIQASDRETLIRLNPAEFEPGYERPRRKNRST